MIDWLTMVVPCKHQTPIDGGKVLCVDANGELSWESKKKRRVEGSFGGSIGVATAAHEGPDPCTHLWIDGNPAKWFQGHNLWGTDDLHGLAVATIEALVEQLGLTPTDEDRAAWAEGRIRLTRVDCTESFHLRSRAEVLAWLRSAEQTAHLANRGRGQLMKGSTLYFGKNSRRWSLKLYSKGQEIRAKGHGQDAVLALPHAVEWADKTLRAELTLRGMELQRLNLAYVGQWSDKDSPGEGVTLELLRSRLEGMTMTTTANLPADVLDSMRPALRMAYQSWESGSDLRAILPKPTFYKFRKELLVHGIDIATVVPKEVSNVVPLFKTLEAVPAAIPDWAVGTNLYYEPRRLRVVG
ncbi:phage/plasmid replication protein, II/X family (plasmid) [Xanthomonas citri pv. glycines]|uniref:phage/plasmid replication protein, II/X family n=5 Tax=Xanthomonas citri TaxID=346 RepID=UPI00036FB46A|nr:phage/plasmid replication protein, II/X family [Xanthomonas citri]ARV25451.1 hypothetical protein A9D66_23330 [Xanthomonas citri pv. glycines str. 12-2]QEQ76097.1 hypothetical protein C2859_24225 [Xanthomonas citri pv. glycines]UIX78444.1 phage/plasmid replication protein, II/X family [Xanthomonas citri pv. glycines]